jgi:hypothetical protein
MSVLDLQVLETVRESEDDGCGWGGSEVSLLLCDSEASVLLCL